MRAVVHTRYGSPELLEIREVDTPIPKPNEVRIKIVSASLNATDFEIVRGDFIVRLTGGIRKPKNPRLGCDFAGLVDAIGSDVTEFAIADEVYADLMYQKKSFGSLAEYVCVPESRLRRKLDHLTFDESATIPQAGTLAVQGIRGDSPPKTGDKVLINGAGGGVGTIALQLAKHYGAEVTAVDHPHKFELMSSLGADYVIDCTSQDFTKLGNKYDLILDVIARKSVYAYRRALKPNGKYRMVGGSMRRIFGVLIFGSIISRFSSKKVGVLMGRPNDKEDMKFLSELCKEGKIKPIIDKVYSLDEAPQAIKYLMDGLAKGKVIIKMNK